MTEPSVTALILAGGMGRRMGHQDKGWVSYKGKPLIQHAINTALPQVQDIVISYNQNEVRYSALPYRCATDLTPGFLGPLMGVLSCRKLISTELSFIMPCDTPGLPYDIVSRLLASLGDHELAVVHDGIRLQPLIFLTRTQLIDSIEFYLEAGNRTVAGWLNSMDTVVVDLSDQQSAFWNLNEISQLQD
ncbi:MAG: molybdenum cofactor guanylyltransferase [Gammaproteobacteria bacterium]|jgi:molybdopterin-guanine dinucleotide biosynthesis protein A|nr:molybdenum cofactor guanylyltransferase [Gammaproteobacteria bacterium]|tara:strand:+ start:504 stop:1070 length:567 start_codon:yes stop_codon:yes gene_type:complete